MAAPILVVVVTTLIMGVGTVALIVMTVLG
jgi:hypothetical protein